MLAFCVLLPLHAPVRRDVDLVDDLLGQASGFGVVPLLLFHHLLLRCLHASEKRRGKAHTITPPHHIVELEAKLETERLEIVLGLAFQVLSACTRWITCAETPTPQWHARQRRGKHENEKKKTASHFYSLYFQPRRSKSRSRLMSTLGIAKTHTRFALERKRA